MNAATYAFMRITRLQVAVAVCLVVVMVVPGVLMFDTTASNGIPGATNTAASASVHTYPTPIRHVVVVMDENSAITATLAQPYFNYLAHHYAIADNFFSARHNSLNDYIAGTSGELNLAFNQTELNVGDLADAAGVSWDGFMESMPTACDFSDTPLYGVSHNPFVHYQDIAANYSRCVNHVLPLSVFNSELSSGTIPAYSWVTPNEFDDGHTPGNVTNANNWLASWLPTVINSSAFSSTVVFVTFDEGYGGLPYGTGGGQIATIAISPYIRDGYSSLVPYNTYSLLTTSEWLLGLGSTGHNDSWSQSPPMYDLFTFEPTFTVSGTVTNLAGSILYGANITDSVYTWAGARAGGAYSLSAANGTYAITASAPGYYPESKLLTVSGGPVSKFNFALTPNPIYATLRSVTGTVATSGTTPIAGATVAYALNGSLQTVTATASGGFTASVPNGTYVFEANAKGYQPKIAFVNVTSNNVIVPTFHLIAQSNTSVFEVTGRAIYPNGTGFPSGTITTLNGSSLWSTVTNPNGYLQGYLPDGQYLFTMDRPGFVWSTITGQVSNGWVVLAPPFMSAPARSISGQVGSSSGGTVPNVVIAYQLAGDTISIHPSPTGAFSVWVVGGETYGLTASAPGYNPETLLSTVANVSVTLAPFVLSVSKAGPTAYYSVSGKIGSTSGATLAGATISYPLNGTTMSTTTGSLGTYAIQLPNGTYALSANHTGYYPGSLNITVAGASVTVGTIELLSSATYTVTVRVTSLNGTAIAGIIVSYSGGGRSGQLGLPTTTAGYTSGPLLNGTYSMSLTSPGWVTQTVPATVKGAALSLGTVKLTRAPYYVLSGTVEALGGSPLPGSLVSFVLNGTAQNLTTNGQGNFSLRLHNGTFSFTASAPNYFAETLTATIAGGPMVLGPFTLTSSFTYPVTVQVTSPTGAPLSGAIVNYTISGSTHQLGGVTGTSGYTSGSLLNGTYVITGSASGFGSGSANLTIAGAGATLTLRLNGGAPPQPTYKLTVHVVSATSGSAIAGAWVNTTVSGQSLACGAPTSSSGYSSCNMVNGTHPFTISANGYARQSVNITVSGTTVAPSVKLSKPVVVSTYSISVQVRAANGTPLSGVSIAYSGAASGTVPLTNASGGAVIILANGTYELTASLSGFTSTSSLETIAGENLTVTLTMTPTPVTTAPPTTFKLTVHVTTTAGVAIAGAVVTYVSGGATDQLGAPTASSGYTSGQLANGTYTLTVSDSGYPPVSVSVTVNGAALSASVKL
jgi:large repetitive protein